MAKKSAEERERKDELAKLNKERELLENQLQVIYTCIFKY